MASTKFLGTMDEWMRDQERRMTSVERRKRRLSETTGQTTITVSDTDTINLTLTGDPAAGYGLSGEVSAVPVALLTGPGTIAPALLPAPTPTPLSVTDTTTVDLTLTGAGTAASPWNVKGDVLAVPVALLTGPGTIPPALLPASPVPAATGAWAYLAPATVTVAQNTAFTIGTSATTVWTKELSGGVTLNDTTGAFTIPTAGLYQLTIGVYYDANVSGPNRLAWVANTAGNRVADFYAYGSNPVTKHVGATKTVRLAAGETLRAITFHDAPGPLNILGGPAATYFEFRLVGP